MNDKIIQQAASSVERVFLQEEVEKIARESGFVKRSSGKITAFGLLLVMTVCLTGNGTMTLDGLCDLLQPFSSFRATAQALSLRLNSVYAVQFFKRCLAYLLSKRLKRSALEKIGLLNDFGDIFIEDSTSCSLDERAADGFKGIGGSGSKAGYKIHTIWNATTLLFTSLKITAANVTDQGACYDIIKHLKPGDLVLRDLGYFCIPAFKAIEQAGAYFVSRLKTGVNVYTLEGEKIEDLPKYLDKIRGDSNMAEVDIRIGGKDQYPVRLVAYLVPDAVYNERRRKQRRASQKRGTATSKSSKNNARYTLLITNIPTNLVSAEHLGTLYGYRWQIELFFKTFKSRLHIQMIRGRSKERIECYIIARLIAITAIMSVFSVLRTYIKEVHKRELSFDKFATWTIRNRYLDILFFPEKMDYKVMKMMNIDIFTLCKQRRSRKTALELLETEVSIWEKYASDRPEERVPMAA